MSEKYKLTQEEINKAILKSPYSLPSSPAERGLGEGQMKKYFYAFIQFLSDKINLHLGDVGRDVEELFSSLALSSEEISQLSAYCQGLTEELSSHNDRADAHSVAIGEHNDSETAHQSAIEAHDRISNAHGEAFKAHNTDSLCHGDIRALIEELDESCQSAYNLARGRSKIYPVYSHPGIALLLKDKKLNPGDIITLGEKNMPELVVYEIEAEKWDDDVEIGFYDLYAETVQIELEPGVFYYYKDNGTRLLALESGIDTSKLATKTELSELSASLDSYREENDQAIGDIESALDGIIAIQSSLIGGGA
ncbi:MAG: hypothetical protein J6B29_00785 [Clostridia bacterium]|nr:hypothetical protein [Clostridia bacterium]